MGTVIIFACAFLCFLIPPGGHTQSTSRCPIAISSNTTGTKFNCEKPASCPNITQVYPSEDPTIFYACIEGDIHKIDCKPEQCFDAESKKCVRADAWTDKCDRSPKTTTTTTTTTTTPPPFTGKICPGATNVRPGDDKCERPICYSFIDRKKYPTKEPKEYYFCWFFFFSGISRCPGQTCFDKNRQECVNAAEWRNSCN